MTAAPAVGRASVDPVISASTPIVQAMARGVGVGGLVFAGLSLPDYVRQFSTISPGWDVAFAIAYVLAATALAVGSWFGTARMLRRLAGVVAGIYLIGLATFALAVPVQAIAVPEDVPWITTLMVIGASAAAVSLPSVIAWVYLGACGILITVDRLIYCGQAALLGTVENALFQLFFCGIFVGLAMASRRLGRLLDDAGHAAELEARRGAARSARARERRRIDALMHDNVLSVLLAAGVGGSEPIVADQARRALRQIERYGVDGDSEPVTAEQLIWELQSITTDIVPLAEFRYELDGDRPPPVEVTAAIIEATAEALRNSALHADPADRVASRAVHVHLGDEGVAVLVLDDGVGFDTHAIPTARLGVSVSIVGRMHGVPGGYAALESEPGRGSTVRIGWVAP